MKAAERKAKEEIILAALRKCQSATTACELANVPRRTFYNWQHGSKRFRDAVTDATAAGNDTIDDEIRRRAIEGIEEPLVSMGKLVFLEEPVLDEDGKPMFDEKHRPIMQIVGQIKVRKYSDTLLLAMAKSRMMKYRDRVDLDLLEQINQNTGGAINVNTKDMTAEELQQLKALALAVKARQDEAEKAK